MQWVRAHTSFLLQMEWHTEQSDIEDTVAQVFASIGKKLGHTLPTYGKQTLHEHGQLDLLRILRVDFEWMHG